MQDSGARRFLHDLYLNQLKTRCVNYAIPFELWRGRRHVYTVYFASNSLKGCNLMKSCAWKVEPSGSYAFRGSSDQLPLPGLSTDELAGQLRRHFGKQPTPIEKIERFVMGDGTIFHKGQLRMMTLRRLEREGRLDVVRPVKRHQELPPWRHEN